MTVATKETVLAEIDAIAGTIRRTTKKVDALLEENAQTGELTEDQLSRLMALKEGRAEIEARVADLQEKAMALP